jgi:mannose-6-phosphate isomerase-like protein (cupin superfamily)
MQTVEKFNPKTEFYTDERCYIVELHNDGNSSIARARVKSGVTTGLHSLLDTFEQYVILEGEGEVEVGENPAVKVQPLDVVNIPADVPQRITNTGEADLIFLCICTPGFKPEVYRNLEK